MCKYFQFIQVKYKNLIQQNFIEILGLDPSPSFVQWNTLLKSLHTTPLEKAFMPYYTDGGTFPSGGGQFIDSLIQENGVYCTENPTNVLVKYAYTSPINFGNYGYPGQFKRGNNVYYLPHIEKNADLHPEVCPYIREIRISLPVDSYTCPANTLMCFSSIKKVEDLSMIHRFYSCTDLEEAITIASELNIQAQRIEHIALDIVHFAQSQRDIQLLCWVKKNYDVRKKFQFTAKLWNPRFARYFYLLLIASYRRRGSTDNNIDIHTVAPYANVVQVREA